MALGSNIPHTNAFICRSRDSDRYRRGGSVSGSKRRSGLPAFKALRRCICPPTRFEETTTESMGKRRKRETVMCECVARWTTKSEKSHQNYFDAFVRTLESSQDDLSGEKRPLEFLCPIQILYGLHLWREYVDYHVICDHAIMAKRGKAKKTKRSS